MNDKINTLEGAKELLKTDGRPPLSDEDKTFIRLVWSKDVSLSAKVQYNDYFLTLERDEQKRISEFWGF